MRLLSQCPEEHEKGQAERHGVAELAHLARFFHGSDTIFAWFLDVHDLYCT